MLGTLLESRKRVPRRRAAAVLSGMAHGVLVVGLVMTRGHETSDGMSKPIAASIVYVAPKVAPLPATHQRPAATRPAPVEPELPRLPPVIVDRPQVDNLLNRSRSPGELLSTLPSGAMSTARDSLVGIGNFDDVMTAMTVDQQVEVIPGQRPPRYPPVLERAGIAGDVIAQFVVDTSGRVERGSLHIQQATHAEFARAVEERLPALRFVPARARGRAVRQLVEQRFHFELVRR